MRAERHYGRLGVRRDDDVPGRTSDARRRSPRVSMLRLKAQAVALRVPPRPALSRHGIRARSVRQRRPGNDIDNVSPRSIPSWRNPVSALGLLRGFAANGDGRSLWKIVDRNMRWMPLGEHFWSDREAAEQIDVNADSGIERSQRRFDSLSNRPYGDVRRQHGAGRGCQATRRAIQAEVIQPAARCGGLRQHRWRDTGWRVPIPARAAETEN